MCFIWVPSYCWSFPNHSPGLGWVWPKVIVAQWFNGRWKAVVLKQASTLQALLPQTLKILLAELHCILVGADAFSPVLLTGHPICCRRHPHFLSSKDIFSGWWAELWTQSRSASFIAAAGDVRTGWNQTGRGLSGQVSRQRQYKYTATTKYKQGHA